MTSFYGNFTSLSGSGDGTSDYNQLLNVPVKNIAGTEDVPILLAALEPGSYNLKGYFKCGNNTDIEIAQNTLVNILIDNETNQKLIQYGLFDSDIYYIVTGTVVDDMNVLLKKNVLNNSGEVGSEAIESAKTELKAYTDEQVESAFALNTF
jgi:hypothetical protein